MEDIARQLKRIEDRLDQLESLSRLRYTKGTWTPIIQGATSAGVGTYTLQVGTWTRIGNRVFYNCTIVWTAHTGIGQIRVAGLAHTSTAREAVAVYTDGITFAGAAPQARMSTPVNYVELSYPVTNAAPTAINVEAAGVLTLNWSMQV